MNAERDRLAGERYRDEQGKTKPRSKTQVDEKLTGTRSPRTIRFTDAEWSKVQRAAAAANISPATFARSAVLNAVVEPTEASDGALPPGMLELVKRTYRSAYILSTLKRDDMIREGRQEQLDRTVQGSAGCRGSRPRRRVRVGPWYPPPRPSGRAFVEALDDSRRTELLLVADRNDRKVDGAGAPP